MTTLPIRWAWIFFDVPRPHAEAALRWWSTRTGTTPSPWRGEHDEFTTLVPLAGPSWLKMQAVDRPPGPATHHLDLDVDDPQAVARVALDLGAEFVHDSGIGYVVLRSPGGFTFCLTTWHGDHEPDASARDHAGASLADQLCLDVPARLLDAELAFWSALAGWDIVPSRARDEFHWTAPDLPIRLLFQRLAEPTDAPVTSHLDIACADRADEVARHVADGAAIVRHRPERPAWTVLTDPWGTTYCCTDRSPATGHLPGIDVGD